MLGMQPTGGGGHLALSYIRQMNRVNSRSDFVTMTAPYRSFPFL